MKRLIGAAVATALTTGSAFAGGFQVNLQGVRQLAMGGTAAALPLDAATIFYNPAGMAVLGGSQINVSGFYLKSYTDFVSGGTGTRYTTESDAATPFNVYGMYNFRGKLNRLSVGLGINTPFGSGVRWPAGWSGRYLIQEISLRSYFFQPTVAYKIHDRISVGAGFVYARGTVDLRQDLPLTYADGTSGSARLEGGGNGYGYNLGVHAVLTKGLTLGLNYRSQVNIKVDGGTATFNVPPSVAANFPAGNTFTSELPLPSNFSAALGYRVSPKLALQAQMDYLSWSAYKELSFDYANNTTALQDTKRPRDWENRAVYRFGAMYNATPALDFMAGYARDKSPVPDGRFSAETPDADRNILTAGITYRRNSKFSVSGTFYYTATDKRDVYNTIDNVNGRIQTKAAAGGIGLSYNF